MLRDILQGTLSRKQSLRLGLSILALFFIVTTILVKTSGRVSRTTVVPANTPKAVSTPEQQAGPGGFTLKQFHRSETKDGRTVWEVTGDNGQYLPEKNIAKIDNAILVLSRKPEENVKLTAGFATLHLTGTELTKAEVSKDVVLIYNEKMELHTDFAIYDKTADSVTAPGKVTISSEKVDVNGEDLIADLNEKVFTLNKNVKSHIKSTKKK